MIRTPADEVISTFPLDSEWIENAFFPLFFRKVPGRIASLACTVSVTPWEANVRLVLETVSATVYDPAFPGFSDTIPYSTTEIFFSTAVTEPILFLILTDRR
jgi:hypothetical protein